MKTICNIHGHQDAKWISTNGVMCPVCYQERHHPEDMISKVVFYDCAIALDKSNPNIDDIQQLIQRSNRIEIHTRGDEYFLLKDRQEKPEWKQADSNYETLEKTLQTLPKTWYPALITTMIEAAIKHKVFIEGMVSKFVANIESKKNKP